jgi:serine/threonine-protein phosphatase 2A regulatory subunit B''
VIYCKFWELDTDHDLFISADVLLKYDNCALSSKIVDRIMYNYGLGKPKSEKNGEILMSYREFIWFLVSEEYKSSPTGIEYWFRCMDIDGDGVISMYEMEYFYAEQIERMERMMIEPINFEDCLCQM